MIVFTFLGNKGQQTWSNYLQFPRIFAILGKWSFASYFRLLLNVFHTSRKSKLWYTIFNPHVFLVLYEALWYEHSSRDARAYSWNVEKLYTFHFLKKPFFIVKSGWLIHFSHSFGVFALVLISVTFHCSIILMVSLAMAWFFFVNTVPYRQH